MKRLLILLSFIPSLAFAQFRVGTLSDLDQSELSRDLKGHISYLSSAALEGRKAGSVGEKEAAIYISQKLQEYGIELISPEEGEVFGVQQDSDTLVSRNVIAFIPGYDKELREEYIVLGARLDNLGKRTVTINGKEEDKIYYGANGNASGLALLIELAKRLQTNSVLLKRSVIIAAFGSSLDLGVGPWYFLNRSFKGEVKSMINLDMLGSNGFYLFTASNRDMSVIAERLKTSLQPIHPQVVTKEPVNSCHRAFYEKEIPFAFFTSGMYPEYNSDKDTESIIEYDNMEREMEYIYNYTLELINSDITPQFRPSDALNTKYNQNVYSYSDCDVKPIFLGSSDPTKFLREWVYKYLRYPKVALDAGVQGRVLVNFTIDEKGKVGNVRVVKGVSEALDEEAIRVVEASPDWKAAKVKGTKVKCELSLYIDFRLEKR